MKVRKLIKLSLATIGILALTVVGCNNIDDDILTGDDLALTELNWIMQNLYYWNAYVPNVKPLSYKSPMELMDALTYKTLDKWSYVTTKQELISYYDEGEFTGFGFGSSFDSQGNLWISFVFKNSPLYSYGVERGWRIAAIDGTTPTPDNYGTLIGAAQTGVEKRFTFIKPNNEIVETSFTKSVLKMNTVLFDSIYTSGNTKIGYIVLKGFITPTRDELNAVFDEFQSKGVNSLILDLRYNGGGSVDVAHRLANQICGSKANGELFLKQEHNQNSDSLNKELYLEPVENTLVLNNLVVIATEATASASELIISGLKPHMNVTVVGDKTYGKPVGMYSLIYPQFNWAFVPICFRFVNSQGFSDYYGGIPADIEADDNIRVPFGSITESSLSAALNHLGYVTTKTSATPTKARLNVGKGLYEEIGSW